MFRAAILLLICCLLSLCCSCWFRQRGRHSLESCRLLPLVVIGHGAIPCSPSSDQARRARAGRKRERRDEGTDGGARGSVAGVPRSLHRSSRLAQGRERGEEGQFARVHLLSLSRPTQRARDGACQRPCRGGRGVLVAQVRARLALVLVCLVLPVLLVLVVQAQAQSLPSDRSGQWVRGADACPFSIAMMSRSVSCSSRSMCACLDPGNLHTCTQHRVDDEGTIVRAPSP